MYFAFVCWLLICITFVQFNGRGLQSFAWLGDSPSLTVEYPDQWADCEYLFYLLRYVFEIILLLRLDKQKVKFYCKKFWMIWSFAVKYNIACFAENEELSSRKDTPNILQNMTKLFVGIHIFVRINFRQSALCYRTYFLLYSFWQSL